MAVICCAVCSVKLALVVRPLSHTDFREHRRLFRPFPEGRSHLGGGRRGSTAKTLQQAGNELPSSVVSKTIKNRLYLAAPDGEARIS